MCELTQPYTEKDEFTGYKLVAETSDGKNHSVAMGFCYDDHETIPVVQVQNRILSGFSCDILDEIQYAYDLTLFREDMVGRTAVFQDLDGAERFFKSIKSGLNHEGDEIFKINGETPVIKIKRATVRGSLWEGVYRNGSLVSVIAGIKIEFHETITGLQYNTDCGYYEALEST